MTETNPQATFPPRDGLACFDCDHVSADLVELHNHIWRNH